MTKKRPGLTQEKIGKILVLQRTTENLSQRDIALVMGYRNINFISMIEHGTSKPPIGKVGQLCKAYQMDSNFSAVIVKYEYPEAWTAFKEVLNAFGHSDIEGELNDFVEKLYKEFGI